MLPWNLFSLVLAAATGWTALALGYLPVGTLRHRVREPLGLIGAWMIVAATAPPAVFHWYLIFAILCLVAWTKLDRPAGKFWLAAAGALGLTLGLVFPLEAAPLLPAREDLLALGSLYFGGAVAGLAAALFALSGANARPAAATPGLARTLLGLALAWFGLITWEFCVRHGAASSAFPLATSSSPAMRVTPPAWTLLAAAAAVFLPALLTWSASRRGAMRKIRQGAAATALLALVAGWLAQWFFV